MRRKVLGQLLRRQDAVGGRLTGIIAGGESQFFGAAAVLLCQPICRSDITPWQREFEAARTN